MVGAFDMVERPTLETRLIATLPAHNQLGECVLWHAPSQSIYWTDIERRELLRCHWPSRHIERTQLPDRLCAFGFQADSDWLICAFDRGFARYRPATGERHWLYPLPDTHELRLNDGRVDPQGRFWAGSMIENATNSSPLLHKQAQLYCCDQRGNVSSHLQGIHISNGLCWSPDGCQQYFADSPRQKIYRFDVEQKPYNLSSQQLFANTEPGHFPDGATVDAEGRLWSAQWGSGEVLCYAPDGSILHRVDVPATQVTCVAFGGPQLDLLIVTSARCNLSARALARQPEAGHLFVYQTHTRGLAEHHYQWRG